MNREKAMPVAIGATLLVLAFSFGYYWLQYIPSQQEYFLTLRFRVLASMGSQVRVKLENLESSLAFLARVKNAEGYAKALVPDLRLGAHDQAGHAKMHFVSAGDGMRMYLHQEEHTAYAELKEVLLPLTRDDLFHDILLADGEGRVLYQREGRGARVTELQQLIESKELYKELREQVMHGGLQHHLFMQKIQIGLPARAPRRPGTTTEGTTLLLCGLTRSAELSEQVRHVAPQLFLFVFLPLMAALLAGPLMKLVMLPPTGRVRFLDVARLTGFTVLASGLGTLLLLGYAGASAERRRMEPELEREAAGLEQELANQLGSLAKFVRGVDRKAAEWDASGCLEKAGEGCIRRVKKKEVEYVPAAAVNLWNPEQRRHLGEEWENIDFLFWASREGRQLEKWTTKRMPTSAVGVSGRPYFDGLAQRRLVRVHGGEGFTLQGLLSATTAQPIWVLAMESVRKGKVGGTEIYAVTAVADLKEMTRRILPPGAGFALLNSDGSVLLHSERMLSMQENLLDETPQADSLRAAVRGRVKNTMRAYYRGRQYLMHSRPVTLVQGPEWTLVTFRNLELREASNWLATGTAGLMLLVYLAGLVLALGMLLAMVTRPWRYRPRRRMLEATRIFWPCRRRLGQYKRVAAAAGGLVGLWVVLLGLSQAGAVGNNWILAGCALIPLAAVGAAVGITHMMPLGSSAAATRRETGWWYAGNLYLLCLLAGVIPANGFLRVCYDHQNWRTTKEWVQALGQGLERSWAQEASELRGSPAYSEEGKDYVEERWLSRRRCGSLDAMTADYGRYLNRLSVECAEYRKREEAGGGFGWQWVMDAMVGDRLAQMAGLGPAESLRGGDQWWMRCEGNECKKLDMEYQVGVWEPSMTGGQRKQLVIRAGMEPLGMPSGLGFWTVAAIGLGLLLWWIHKTTGMLYLMSTESTVLPDLKQAILDAKLGEPLLAVGLPLSGKDYAVAEAWRERLKIEDEKEAPPRITLLEEKAKEGWAEEKVAWVRQQLFVEGEAAAATVGGGTKKGASKGEPWLHISNLECMLGNVEDRKAILELLERLAAKPEDGREFGMVITTSLDPSVHFGSVLTEEMQAVYKDPLPEGELQRWGRVLHRFRRVQVVEPALAKNGGGVQWRERLWEECRLHRPLHKVHERLLPEMAAMKPAPSTEMVTTRTAEEAQAFYRLVWSSLTRSEKLLLIQLAQSGYVNPRCTQTLENLERKGLVLVDPQPRILNETFEAFLEGVESVETVRAWEQEGGKSIWPMLRNLLWAVVVFGLLVMAATQRQAFQSLAGLVTGLAAVLGGGFKIVEMIRKRVGAAPEGV